MIVYINRRKDSKVIKSECYHLKYIGPGISNINFELSNEDTVFIHLPVGSSKEELIPLSWEQYLEDNDKEHLLNICSKYKMEIVKHNKINSIDDTNT